MRKNQRRDDSGVGFDGVFRRLHTEFAPGDFISIGFAVLVKDIVFIGW